MNKLNRVGKVAYNTTALYGRVRSILGTIAATIFSIVFIIIGLRMIIDSRKYSKNIIADITNASCYQTENKGYTCELDVSYKVGNKTYTSNISSNDNRKYATGNKIQVAYNINNPQDVVIPINQLYILLFIFGGLLMLVSSWINLYFVMRNKTYAAIEGTAGLVNNFIIRKNRNRKN